LKNAGRSDFSSAAQEWRERVTRWNDARAGAAAPVESGAYWDSFALWEEYEQYTCYPGALLNTAALSVDPDTTILDVGAGTGSLAVPLARKARSVTALEPSAAQEERLRRRIEKEHCTNVRIVRRNWQEADLAELGAHDLVIASYSLFMEDIVPAVRKLIDAASKRIVIVHLHSHDLQPLPGKIKGDGAPDAGLLLRVLQEMGVPVKTGIIDRAFSLPLELQLQMFRYTQNFTDAEIRALEAELHRQQRTFTEDGRLWLRRLYRDAVLTVDEGFKACG
jgi:FkbM family methyltransferase